ncbi:MAG: glycosyltransferase [Deltaproteobacteria bacterium]|nr:glycosyltransferase [Deltaproteobacteria bacterium]
MRLPRVAYVMTFPVLSETFILREMRELRRRGVDLRILSIRTPDRRVMHGDAAELLERTVYAPFLLSGRVLAANLSALVRRPAALLRALRDALHVTRGMPGERLKALALFPKSVYFARVVEEQGLEHVHALYSGAHAVVALVVSDLTGRPFSFAVRSSDQLYIRNRGLPDLIGRASFVKAVTELYRQDLLQARRLWGRDVERYAERFPGDKVVVVRSPIDLEAYTPRTREPGGRRVLAVGRLDGHKGFRYLVEAFRILRDRGVEFQAEIVGGGPLRDDLGRRIVAAGLRDRVLLTGPLPQEEVKARYLQARAVAVSSLWEGLPNVLMEALALGVPVVTTDVAGIPELVRHEQEGLLVPPKDPAALADGIQRLLEDGALRRSLAARGREAVEREFGVRLNADRILRQFLLHTPGCGADPDMEGTS